jgi:ABC-2 type transport system ATP-binding protein
MDEAERLCDRVAIVDHGKVIALGRPHELIAGLGGEHVIEFSLAGGNGRAALDPAALASLPAVRSVHQEGELTRLAVSEPHVALPALLGQLSSLGHELASLTTRHASLEDVFVTLTGRHLREADED